MTKRGKYTIKIQGRVGESEINRDTPWQMSLVEARPEATLFTVRTDQSGLVGLVRHLHGTGFVLLAVAGEDDHPLAAPMPAFTDGEEQMNERILVAYATCTGSTAEVAAAIGETIAKKGFAVDVKPMSGDLSPAGYRALILGSAVQHGNWLPEAIDFVQANQAALRQLPVALFCVHVQNTGDDETSRRRRHAYLDQVRALVTPTAEGYFPGRFDRRGARLMLPRLVSYLVPTLDFRKWGEIRRWAEQLPLSWPAPADRGAPASAQRG